MRILRTPDPVAAIPASPAVPPPAQVLRLEPLFDKIQDLEDRLRSLEQSQKQPKSNVPLAPVTLDPDAVKKALLSKMWKYLHDEQPPKTI